MTLITVNILVIHNKESILFSTMKACKFYHRNILHSVFNKKQLSAWSPRVCTGPPAKYMQGPATPIMSPNFANGQS